MQHLTLVGLTEDRSTLLLVGDSGEEYSLPADAKLLETVRVADQRAGRLETQMDSALRPRDIQARIRAGESPETVAEAAQSTVDRIMRYASPVLAERAHIAERAQRASVRRRGTEGQSRVLGEVVAERLRRENVDPGNVAWDSWRREDGRWTLVADFRVEDRSRRAEFIFDVVGRYVLAEDGEARWLTGDEGAQPSTPPVAGAPRRLSAVTPEEELPLGDDAIELVTEQEPSVEAGPEESTVDLTPTARRLRSGARERRSSARAGSRWEEAATGRSSDRDADRTPGPAGGRAARSAGTGDADWMATQASDRPAARAVSPPVSEPSAHLPTGSPTGPGRHDAPDAGDTGDAGAARDTGAAADGPAEAEPSSAPSAPTAEEAPPASKKAGRKNRRASVPSWDEIMFGGGQSE